MLIDLEDEDLNADLNIKTRIHRVNLLKHIHKLRESQVEVKQNRGGMSKQIKKLKIRQIVMEKEKSVMLKEKTRLLETIKSLKKANSELNKLDEDKKVYIYIYIILTNIILR